MFNTLKKGTSREREREEEGERMDMKEQTEKGLTGIRREIKPEIDKTGKYNQRRRDSTKMENETAYKDESGHGTRKVNRCVYILFTHK